MKTDLLSKRYQLNNQAIVNYLCRTKVFFNSFDRTLLTFCGKLFSLYQRLNPIFFLFTSQYYSLLSILVVLLILSDTQIMFFSQNLLLILITNFIFLSVRKIFFKHTK